MPHREILFQNDGYTAKGTVQLRVNEFGVFYVFVDIDRYNRVSVHLLKSCRDRDFLYSLTQRLLHR